MIKLIKLLSALIFTPVVGWCITLDNQVALRQGKVEIENNESVINIGNYPFLHQSINRINMNGDDWSELRDKFNNIDSTSVTILHIGDSHIQADVLTNRVRTHFWKQFGSGGRGLITPLKICGTNEPYNYKFTTNVNTISAKLMKLPWLTDMGFTGTAFTPRSLKYNVTVSTDVNRMPEGEPFNKIRIFANGMIYVDKILDSGNAEVMPVIYRTDDYIDINLARSVTTANMNLHSFEPVTIYGAVLLNNNIGVVYHAIGNNGATYSSYNRLGSMGKDISMLSPDLVIISLGTNEAFGKTDNDSFYAEIEYLVKDIKRKNPSVKILLTTPMECQRSSRVVTRNRRTRKRVYSSARNYSVNTNVKQMRDVIMSYGAKNGVPVYDWYSIAGGNGASNQWVESNLMSKDRIHDTSAGYEISGDMLYDALQHAIFTNSKTTFSR